MANIGLASAFSSPEIVEKIKSAMKNNQKFHAFFATLLEPECMGRKLLF